MKVACCKSFDVTRLTGWLYGVEAGLEWIKCGEWQNDQWFCNQKVFGYLPLEERERDGEREDSWSL